MKKYFITFDEDPGIIDTQSYESLEEAKAVANKILNGGVLDEESIEDLVADYEGGYELDKLFIQEAIPATFPDMGEMVADQLDDWAISEGTEDYLEPILNKDVDELNTMITSWLLKKGYKPNWYNILECYPVVKEDEL
ncbi:hypothetical protein 8014-B2_00103 [Lactobacillus phage ATCC 8014-B2]|uniref:Uncharacterized protein n=1 Tax=Lactobacillus phage ATCC 8014-B2 TaxID=1225795 RepID=K4I4G2_9CAUD|nr:hypothetical protein HOQ89_gp043 [Lactobacillus phage ATCC 8014-B2]AFU63170.1 hypothetical protein 8014-B2_00103 [Lactobacillus phage ATCC 8014-B2]